MKTSGVRNDTIIRVLFILIVISFILFVSSSSFFFPDPPIFESFNVDNGLKSSKIAVCLVGGARHFELTGPSIIDRIFRVYPNSDLFLHTPLDSNAYKLFLLNEAPRIASVRIFRPEHIPETAEAQRVLTPYGSSNGLQGLLQYFNLTEGCLNLIESHQVKDNFTYDWIIRTRVDGYWSAPLGLESFNPGKYTVPMGVSFGGLNDRFGVGDYNTSFVALKRLSLIPNLDSAGFTQEISESAFRAQLITHNVEFITTLVPFCIVTDHRFGVPSKNPDMALLALSSLGPLQGAYCRPCTVACGGSCAVTAMKAIREWWGNDKVELCDGSGGWESGWEEVFDKTVGGRLASKRKLIKDLKIEKCVVEFEKMKKKSAHWDVPPAEEICKMGLENQSAG